MQKHCSHHNVPAPLPPVNSSGIQYTCPMHPQIVQNSPGNCPICGMMLEPVQVLETPQENAELHDMTVRFWVAVIFTIPLLILTMGMDIPGIDRWIGRIPAPLFNWLQFILATPVYLWCGWPLLTRGFRSMITGRLNMFSLIALGTTIAYVYSVIGWLFPQLFPAQFLNMHGHVFLYFEAAAAITTLVLMGQVLEIRGREMTGAALRALLSLTPKTALRVTAQGQQQEIPLQEVKVNDLLKVRPGEKVPVDGKIIEGHSSMDQSMVTGESIPVEKTRGETVIGGTLNLSGSFIMQAEKVGSETMLSQIVAQVSQAQRSRAPIQRLADLVAAYFVPIVVVVAIITFAIWAYFGPAPAMTYGLISAISVLIIACPCALGLATPMSITVGMGLGAQHGILVRNAESLERFEKVNVLLVDKTGTLTEGKPRVHSIIATSDFTQDEILQYAASLELSSEHPLAQAIIAEAHARQLHLIQPQDFQAEVGKGIVGYIKGHEVVLGNKKMLELRHIKVHKLEEKAESLRKQGGTVMFLLIDNQIKGIISVADPLKSTTKQALQRLQQDGVKVYMLTGDNETTAKAIAKELPIDGITANILPTEKNSIVKHFKQRGNVVAMAGDGINDAAALAEADIGIAMGTGTDIAMKSASITLVRGDLLGIARARRLSEQVMKNIRENLFLAFIYNILCIPIAAGVLYPWTGLLLSPMIAALAMSLSSVSVIFNALRLRYVKLN